MGYAPNPWGYLGGKAMKLTDTAIRKAKYNPTGKGNSLFDGGGLYVELSPAGGKLWRLEHFWLRTYP